MGRMGRGGQGSVLPSFRKPWRSSEQISPGRRGKEVELALCSQASRAYHTVLFVTFYERDLSYAYLGAVPQPTCKEGWETIQP